MCYNCKLVLETAPIGSCNFNSCVQLSSGEYPPWCNTNFYEYEVFIDRKMLLKCTIGTCVLSVSHQSHRKNSVDDVLSPDIFIYMY